MSAVIGIFTPEGILLAADDRAIMGDVNQQGTIVNGVRKIGPLGKGGFGVVASAAGGGSAFALLRELSKRVIFGSNTDEVLNSLSQQLQEISNARYGTMAIRERPPVAFLFAGYRENGSAEMLILRSADAFRAEPMVPGPPSHCLSVSDAASFGLTFFHSGMGMEEAKHIAAFSIIMSNKINVAVGSGMHMAVITPEGFTPLDDAELRRIIGNAQALEKGVSEYISGELTRLRVSSPSSSRPESPAA
jgi:20S proteasome alpha/beta subunit